jgi:hypothetical protein
MEHSIPSSNKGKNFLLKNEIFSQIFTPKHPSPQNVENQTFNKTGLCLRLKSDKVGQISFGIIF